jgi:hypothetical protein
MVEAWRGEISSSSLLDQRIDAGRSRTDPNGMSDDERRYGHLLDAAASRTFGPQHSAVLPEAATPEPTLSGSVVLTRMERTLCNSTRL